MSNKQLKTERLTEEELNLVKQYREAKARTDAANLAEELRLKRVQDLEAEFAAAVKESQHEISKCLQLANEQIQKAIEISERTGIPFTLFIEGLPSGRKYTPDSLSSKWKDIDNNILYSYNIWERASAGWEYWNTSSLSC